MLQCDGRKKSSPYKNPLGSLEDVKFAPEKKKDEGNTC